MRIFENIKLLKFKFFEKLIMDFKDFVSASENPEDIFNLKEQLGILHIN